MTEAQKTSPFTPKLISTSTRIAFGLAQFGMAVIGGVYGGLLTKFYQDYMGVGPKLFGIAMIVFAVWNALNDPIFGELTDRTKSKLGRRIPYLRYTAPFYGATFIALWFCPEHASEIGKFWWMLIGIILYDTCFTIIGLVHGTLMPELSESDEERGKLSIVASLFGLLGTLFGFVIPDMVRPRAGDVAASLVPLRIASIVVGIVCAGCILYASYKIKEQPEYMEVDEPLPWWKAIKSTLTNKSFIVYVIASFMVTFMFAIAMGAIFYLSDYVVKGPAIPLLAAMFIPLAIGAPLMKFVLQKMEPARAWEISLLIAGFGFALLYFLPVNLLMVGLAIAGLGYAGVQVLNQIVLSQVIDNDEIRTGVRREGSYLGANALITKPAQSVAYTLINSLLAASGFVTVSANNGVLFLDQPHSALMAIRALVGLIPGIALMLGAVALHFFPITGKKLKEQQATILNMHARKQAELAARRGESLAIEEVEG